MVKRLRTLIALAALAPVAAATPLWANATYTFTSFEGGGNNPGGTTVDGINHNDRIVGFSTDLNPNVTDWIGNTNGGFTILHLPVGSLANGINITPTVVGQNGSLAFVFSGGIHSILPNVNGSTTSEFAFGVNDKETIVGEYADSNTGTTPGFVYISGALATVNPVVNALVTNAQGINNNGVVTLILLHGRYTLSRIPVQHRDRQLHVNCRSQRSKLRVLATARHSTIRNRGWLPRHNQHQPARLPV